MIDQANNCACLYHGTPELVDRIEPRRARGSASESDRLCAVYASHDRAYATAFALPIVPDSQGKLVWSFTFVNHTARIKIEAGRLDLRRSGYVYRVPPDDFVRLDEFQWVSYVPVVPLERAVIDPAEYAEWVRPLEDARGRRVKPMGDLADIDYERLWRYVASETRRSVSSLHGPDHWRRVEHNALRLATRTGADVTVARLFALFHDCRRKNESRDDGHGARGAMFAERLRNVLFDVPDEQFDQLRFACIGHTDGYCHDDPTIGTCWDADRLDLDRVGVLPDPRFMSTDFGRELAMSRPAIGPVAMSAGDSHDEALDWVSNYGGL